MSARRLLLVHAHPDDESIATGAVMARYAAAGARVTLLTCTLGEEGEILVPELARLEAAQADQLGGYRIGELAAAMRALGVADHRFLGGAGRFRDSGMIDTPANKHPRAFWRADSEAGVFDSAVEAAVEVIRDVRPHVLVTYDDNGDYGHPDHVMASRVALAAAERAADPAYGQGPVWQIRKIYWTATPRSVLAEGCEAVRAAEGVPFAAMGPDEVGFGVDDSLVTTTVDASAHTAAKRAALLAHRTQVAVHGWFFALSNHIGRPISGQEHFRLVEGELGRERDADGRETDLFAGLPADPDGGS